MQAFQQQLKTLEDADTQVLGVSMDSPFANKAWAKQINVTFPLLSDMGGDVTKEYGIYEPKYKAARRVTYLIDKDGKVVEMQKDSDAIDPTAVVTSCQRRRMKSGQEADRQVPRELPSLGDRAIGSSGDLVSHHPMTRWPDFLKMQQLAGKIAVVTGGSRGIGLAIARELAMGGCFVTIAGRDPQALKRAVAEFESQGPALLSQPCDVASETEVENLFSSVQRRFGKLDYVVNNAGAAHALANVDRLSVSEFRRVLDVNLTGTFLCSRAAIPLMSAGAVIVNNLSVAAIQAFAGMSAYCAAKAGALAFTNTLREELREKGIRVLALIPGAVNTEIWNQFWPEAPREKMISAADVARAVVLALSMPQGTSVDEIRMGPALGAL